MTGHAGHGWRRQTCDNNKQQASDILTYQNTFSQLVETAINISWIAFHSLGLIMCQYMF